MIKCENCGKLFASEKGLIKHINLMFGKEQKKGEKIHCPSFVYKSKFLGQQEFSKEYLKNEYINKKKTSIEISEEIGIVKCQLLKMLHYYKIKLRSSGEAKKLSIEKNGLWNKGLTKWEHPSIMKYAKSRVGRNNPFYTAPGYEIRKQKLLDVSSKARKKYSYNNIPKTTEQRMIKILDARGINYIRSFSLRYDKNGFKSWFLYDFLIDGVFILELNGDYWHANPKFYKANDIVKAKGFKLAYEIWEWDKNKVKLAISRGYKCFVLWESEMSSMDDNEIWNSIEKQLRIK